MAQQPRVPAGQPTGGQWAKVPGGLHDPLRDPAPAREPGFVYHATNEENLEGIQAIGLIPHKPNYGTDQDNWPDGSIKKRSYFIDEPASASSFAPVEGRPVLVRVPEAGMKRESTGDRYTSEKIRAELVEVLARNGQWYVVKEKK
jgi:hypothetical protein